MDNYAQLVQNNLTQFYETRTVDAADRLNAQQDGDEFKFRAFGEECLIRPGEIFLSGIQETGVLGILISLYALHARSDPLIQAPFRAYKDFQGSMPYAGAFVNRTEQALIPYVGRIHNTFDALIERFDGESGPADLSGDISFVIQPFPKIALCYLFYFEDDDFPPSATCLFSNNADAFLPLDGLADTGEYATAKMIEFIQPDR